MQIVPPSAVRGHTHGVTEEGLTRRRLLELGLALPLPLALAGEAGAVPLLAPTPACDDGPTEPNPEGPFFTPRSPRRRSLLARGMQGTKLVLTGRVLTSRCRPVRGAVVDFWQADAAGRYDNEGFRLRGHQLTDARGRYRLETVVPGLYAERTRHIHVKVKAPGRPLLTTQLYFPGVRQNGSDVLFDADLLVRLSKARAVWRAAFDFVVGV